MAKEKKVSPTVDIEVEEEEERETLIKWIEEEHPWIAEVEDEARRTEEEFRRFLEEHDLTRYWEEGDIWFTVIPGKRREEEEVE